MDLIEDVKKIIGQPENNRLEYKAVLPPSRTIAQLISGFANTEGGYILLGIVDGVKPKVIGLSEDFHANAIVHKAIDLLDPKPYILYQYLTIEGKRIYAIRVQKSENPVLAEGKLFIRKGDLTTENESEQKVFKKSGYSRIKTFAEKLRILKTRGTSSKLKFIDHYLSVLNLADDLGEILYPESPQIVTSNSEGKILQRILYASCADNFETYLSDLLYEIYLANPNSLKSKQQVTIEEVLSCSDMQEFVNYWAKKKLSKLQRGSVKAFVVENKQISDLNV
ncbi:MAG: helix-turn-helix domain-containing protein [Bacteroidota bacterium]